MLVDVLRGSRPEVRAHLDAAQARGDELFISSVVVHELAAGAFASRQPERRLLELDALLSSIPPVAFTPDDAMAAARVRADLQSAGNRIGALDVLIAGHALARGWTLVTGNVGHFERVYDLSIIDWTISDQPIDHLARATRPHRAPKD